MKHSITVKFLAFILCALSLVAMIFSGFGVGFMQAYDLYNTPLDIIQQDQMDFASSTLADYYTQWHAAETFSNAPESLLSELFSSYYVNHIGSQYAVEIYEGGELVYCINNADDLMGQKYAFTYTITPNYPIVTGEVYAPSPSATPFPTQPDISEMTLPPETEPPIYTEPIPSATFPAANEHPSHIEGSQALTPTEPSSPEAAQPTEAELPELVDAIPTEAPVADYGLTAASEEPAPTAYDEVLARVAGQEPLYTDEYHSSYTDDYGNWRELIYTLSYYEAPTYEVTVYLSSQTIMDADFMLVSALYPYRDYYIPTVLGALVIFIITLVFLFSVAGRRSKGEVHLAAINRIPLDLYAACCAGLVVLLTLPVIWLFESALYQRGYNIWDNPQLCLLICCLCGFGIASLIIGFLYAFAAQVKASNNYWLRHTVIGWALGFSVKILRYVFGLAGKALRWLGHGFSCAFQGCRAMGRMLPIIWQWLLTAFLMVFIPFISIAIFSSAHGFGEFFWGLMVFASIAADVTLVCYGAWCFGVLLKGVKHMTQGNLNHQIDTRYLYGCFKDYAVHLNSLAGAAQVAAQRQLKSERMRTELITNVSHDIKTPLTSIINYVDLLKKPHSDEDGESYLDVLDRQSQRLKKLIDDLMDMSKASSGSMNVELTQVDVVEAVNQALGEFADKLEKVNLTPVFRHPDFPVIMQADGRLIWRVLSNLLSNAVKYAMPDTRLYVDLMVLQGNAVLAIKNISRDQLNVNADELMERFVRGDTSRNTEGSGLGLNIAKSLVELQKGQMHLMVDGDLFKVTLIFPLV